MIAEKHFAKIERPNGSFAAPAAPATYETLCGAKTDMLNVYTWAANRPHVTCDGCIFLLFLKDLEKL